MSHVLLFEHDAREARFVQSSLARMGWTDVMVWHEPTLSRGLTLLGLCQFRLVLLGASLPEQPLDEALRAIGESAPGVPVVVMRDRTEEDASAESLSVVRLLLGR